LRRRGRSINLKQIIKREILARDLAFNDFTIPGEPLIYSIKCRIGTRKRTSDYYRNIQWRSILKCRLAEYLNSKIPVVIFVKFYVSPPDHVKTDKINLRKENTPATQCFEVLDYTLSFLEILHKAMFSCYKQIVKIEIEKFYSSRPRTVFKFMKWDHYVDIQNNNPLRSKAKSIDKIGPEENVHAEHPGNDSDKAVCSPISESSRDIEAPVNEGPLIRDSPLSYENCSSETKRKRPTAKLPTSRPQARC